ncbi:OmpA family protein [Erythrobacter litoralis]|uniref:OmpA family protein n=1 Tax=Erythrobacter litoralis TaxID=39960 RepID=UPI00243558E7|nr:OmpA family protein [Erythrobacter litoralis]MDG6080043.1 OmpA family protein [Erythrobacter litoralis]
MTARSLSVRSYLAMTALSLGLLTGACRNEPAPAPSPTPTESDAPRSIFQPEFQETESADELPIAPEPLRETVGFPEGGSEIDEAGMRILETVLGSSQLAEDWPIVLRGHSDAGGSGEVNLRASRARAEAVREALIEGGVAEDRITIIAFGEQNPIEPNALPNGEANEEGRAANRRVEITIDSPEDIVKTPGREPTIVETIATPEPGPSPLTSPTPAASRRR